MSVNIEVTLRPGESAEKLIKRFFKKCKKDNVVKEYLEKTSYFKTNRQKRKEKSLKRAFLEK